MSFRVDYLLFNRRRLVGLQHASDGVLPSERAAFEWSWLESSLAARELPEGVVAAWNMPLRSGRMAICRLMPHGESAAGSHWKIGVIVLESEQHDWILRRLCAAVSDNSFWIAAKFLNRSGLVLPDWGDDPLAGSDDRLAMKEMLQRSVLNAPATVSGCASQVDPQVLRLPILLDRAQRMRLRWCVGLPAPAPGSTVASVRPLVPPKSNPTFSAALQTPPQHDSGRQGNRSAVARHDVPAGGRERARSKSIEEVISGDLRMDRVTFGPTNRAAWGVPFICLGLMLTATLAAWWILRGDTPASQ
jgi:hypothetical protein